MAEYYSEACLNRTSIGPCSYYVRNRQVFDLYRLNQQKFPTLGLYLKFG
jgi:hypothetical protein